MISHSECSPLTDPIHKEVMNFKSYRQYKKLFQDWLLIWESFAFSHNLIA